MPNWIDRQHTHNRSYGALPYRDTFAETAARGQTALTSLAKETEDYYSQVGDEFKSRWMTKNPLDAVTYATDKLITTPLLSLAQAPEYAESVRNGDTLGAMGNAALGMMNGLGGAGPVRNVAGKVIAYGPTLIKDSLLDPGIVTAAKTAWNFIKNPKVLGGAAIAAASSPDEAEGAPLKFKSLIDKLFETAPDKNQAGWWKKMFESNPDVAEEYKRSGLKEYLSDEKNLNAIVSKEELATAKKNYESVWPFEVLHDRRATPFNSRGRKDIRSEINKYIDESTTSTDNTSTKRIGEYVNASGNFQEGAYANDVVPAKSDYDWDAYYETPLAATGSEPYNATHMAFSQSKAIPDSTDFAHYISAVRYNREDGSTFKLLEAQSDPHQKAAKAGWQEELPPLPQEVQKEAKGLFDKFDEINKARERGFWYGGGPLDEVREYSSVDNENFHNARYALADYWTNVIKDTPELAAKFDRIDPHPISVGRMQLLRKDGTKVHGNDPAAMLRNAFQGQGVPDRPYKGQRKGVDRWLRKTWDASVFDAADKEVDNFIFSSENEIKNRYGGIAFPARDRIYSEKMPALARETMKKYGIPEENILRTPVSNSKRSMDMFEYLYKNGYDDVPNDLRFDHMQNLGIEKEITDTVSSWGDVLTDAEILNLIKMDTTYGLSHIDISKFKGTESPVIGFKFTPEARIKIMEEGLFK